MSDESEDEEMIRILQESLLDQGGGGGGGGSSSSGGGGGGGSSSSSSGGGGGGGSSSSGDNGEERESPRKRKPSQELESEVDRQQRELRRKAIEEFRKRQEFQNSEEGKKEKLKLVEDSIKPTCSICSGYVDANAIFVDDNDHIKEYPTLNVHTTDANVYQRYRCVNDIKRSRYSDYLQASELQKALQDYDFFIPLSPFNNAEDENLEDDRRQVVSLGCLHAYHRKCLQMFITAKFSVYRRLVDIPCTICRRTIPTNFQDLVGSEKPPRKPYPGWVIDVLEDKTVGNFDRLELIINYYNDTYPLYGYSKAADLFRKEGDEGAINSVHIATKLTILNTIYTESTEYRLSVRILKYCIQMPENNDTFAGVYDDAIFYDNFRLGINTGELLSLDEFRNFILQNRLFSFLLITKFFQDKDLEKIPQDILDIFERYLDNTTFPDDPDLPQKYFKENIFLYSLHNRKEKKDTLAKWMQTKAKWFNAAFLYKILQLVIYRTANILTKLDYNEYSENTNFEDTFSILIELLSTKFAHSSDLQRLIMTCNFYYPTENSAAIIESLRHNGVDFTKNVLETFFKDTVEKSLTGIDMKRRNIMRYIFSIRGGYSEKINLNNSTILEFLLDENYGDLDDEIEILLKNKLGFFTNGTLLFDDVYKTDFIQKTTFRRKKTVALFIIHFFNETRNDVPGEVSRQETFFDRFFKKYLSLNKELIYVILDTIKHGKRLIISNAFLNNIDEIRRDFDLYKRFLSEYPLDENPNSCEKIIMTIDEEPFGFIDVQEIECLKKEFTSNKAYDIIYYICKSKYNQKHVFRKFTELLQEFWTKIKKLPRIVQINENVNFTWFKLFMLLPINPGEEKPIFDLLADAFQFANIVTNENPTYKRERVDVFVNFLQSDFCAYKRLDDKLKILCLNILTLKTDGKTTTPEFYFNLLLQSFLKCFFIIFKGLKENEKELPDWNFLSFFVPFLLEHSINVDTIRNLLFDFSMDFIKNDIEEQTSDVKTISKLTMQLLLIVDKVFTDAQKSKIHKLLNEPKPIQEDTTEYVYDDENDEQNQDELGGGGKKRLNAEILSKIFGYKISQNWNRRDFKLMFQHLDLKTQNIIKQRIHSFL